MVASELKTPQLSGFQRQDRVKLKRSLKCQGFVVRIGHKATVIWPDRFESLISVDPGPNGETFESPYVLDQIRYERCIYVNNDEMESLSKIPKDGLEDLWI